MDEVLPQAIVAPLERLARQLEAWARAHPNPTLADLEQGVLEQVRAALPEVAAGVLRRTSASLQPGAQRLRERCPRCGKRRKPEYRARARTVRTVCGPVPFERLWYHCRPCEHGWSPTDQQLDLGAGQRLSVGLHHWVAKLGATTDSFQAAQRLLEELTGWEATRETVRQKSQALGQQLETAQQAAMQHVEQQQEAAEAVEAAPGLLVVETDGVMVRYLNGWHEVKVGVIGGWTGKRLEAQSYVAAREGPEAFGWRLVAEAARRGALEVVDWEGTPTQPGLAVLRKVVVLADGAVWIWCLSGEHFGERIEILDYYHATEHVWKLARAFYGEGSAKAKRWARRQCGRLLRQGPAPLLRALRATKPQRAEVGEVVRREQGYFTTNADRMRYPEFRAQGLPIGSGAVESAAGHEVQRRMKRPGARWSEPGAQAILTLRTHLDSGRPLPLPTKQVA